MSMRLRLSLIIGSAFVLVWALAAAWMLSDLRQQMMFSLDQRLVASARMVAGLLEQLPPLPVKGEGTHFSAEQLTIPGGMACQVSSLRGEILARSHNHPDEPMQSEATGFHDQVIEGAVWRTFTLDRGDVRITTADRQVEREALNLSVLLAASVPVGMALIVCLFLLWLGIGQGLAPLKRMRDALMRRDADSLQPLQIDPLPSELKPLLDSQNQLLARIAKALERERRLTGDAAHELRSPLTAIKTHLQVARMTDGAAREQSLAHAEAGADRLHRTLEQLLLLARVEGSLSFDDGVQCSAEQVARLAIHDAASGAAERVTLNLPQDLPTTALEVPSVLAIAALRNLLDNALRHAPADTPVELAVRIEGRQVCFAVRDHGPGISPDTLQHMTQRFWRNGNSNGCGLGLAIVQAIVERCAGELKFDSQPDGLRVELRMPLSSHS
ncbi:ATP-binding protein [Pseudomonas helleri]|uniref:histidine kinase n=1 Tax=Pseudomonas helleri TaxID=1608996 RepID=A0A6A7Z098_9PSED|nr:ATP-binding protein [Pseudomonas helleri]MQT28161.1 two-component sensor histidine kinase [Pseudomonas helleri]MQT82731.1 two-component sensor histidine kinase [Pseudomonas helleri]MQU19147.1 two-component sensor histidine kinase [Pseudomonas helleri]MQU29366.1 two-component sensor histidine kinase [Pseudomonas helleri]